MTVLGGELTEYVERSDGRTIAYAQIGDRDGTPVFDLHGTPGSRLSGRHPDASRVAAAGLRVITYDRPGSGRSSRHPGRAVVDCVADIAAIADQLMIERFIVAGTSGGGSHALAAAAGLPQRVIRAECDVGGAPYDAEGLDWFAGMDPGNVKEFGWAVDGEQTLARELRREADAMVSRLDEDPALVLGDVHLSGADRAVLQDPIVQERLRASMREAFAGGVWGWVDDDLAGHLSTPDEQLEKLRLLASG
jgi:pimeloyl-ACP methyl ester carboxylesterase